MYCIYVQDKGYYCGRTGGIRHFSPTLRIIDWTDDIEIIESIAKELTEKYGCKTEIKGICFTSVKEFNPRKKIFFKDIDVGKVFRYKNYAGCWTYIKLSQYETLLIDCPTERKDILYKVEYYDNVMDDAEVVVLN